MSANRYRPHIFVLPEDDANRQLANGFILKIDVPQIRILPPAGGWMQVRDGFIANHVNEMHKFDRRFMVLLVDCDDDLNRPKDVQASVPSDLRDRVFVLGVRTEPEALRQAGLGAYEKIGGGMADDCRNRTQDLWGHDLLSHNGAELGRLRAVLCDLLFSGGGAP